MSTPEPSGERFRPPATRRTVYGLSFLDARRTYGPATRESLEEAPLLATPTFPSRTLQEEDEGGMFLFSNERFYARLILLEDAGREEIGAILRWIGSQATPENLDRWFETWERERLQSAGVRVDFFPPLIDAAMKSLVEQAAAMETIDAHLASEALGAEPAQIVDEDRPSPPPRKSRHRTDHGRRLRYEVVRKRSHAELVFHRGYGKGEVRCVAKVDLADLPRVTCHSWHVSGTVETGLSLETELPPDSPGATPVRLTLHRHLLGAAPGESVSFASGDRMDLRRANLVLGRAARKTYRSNTSGYRGVSLNKATGKYEASVGKKRLGYFATAEEAGAAARAERAPLGWPESPVPNPAPYL